MIEVEVEVMKNNQNHKKKDYTKTMTKPQK